MSRWGMLADLERCVGCQTCTAACRHANATSPAVQWRKVLDVEAGTFPEVSRTFVPVGCQHCADPPCVNACIANALHFGDLDDPASNVSRLLGEQKHFRMHEELGTAPNFHYLYGRADDP